MPTFLVTAPDGRKFRVNAPEGATQDQALSYAKQKFAKQSQDLKLSNPAEYDTSSTEYQERYGAASGSAAENFAAGAGKAIYDLGRGAGQLVGAVSNEDVAESKRLDAPLMETRAGKIGNFAGNVAAAAPTAFVPGANTVAGAGIVGAGLGLLQPTESGSERVTNTLLGGALGAGGQKVGQVAGKYLGGKIAEKSAAAVDEKAANAVRDAALRDARKLGYKVPPATVNQKSVIARGAESLAGKAATQQTAAVHNQQVTNKLVRQELGLSKGAPLTRDTLKTIRNRAGSVYAAIKQSGDIDVDGQYVNDLVDLTRDADQIIKDFPDLKVSGAEEVKALQDGLLRDKFSANGALEVIKKLRSDASKNLAWNVEDPGKKALGHSQIEAAGIVEDMLTRHLQKTGKGSLAGQFENARKLIAKTYSVEAALNSETGNVVAPKLVAQLRKGKPLSGNLEKIAKFAGSVSNSVAKEEMTSPGVSKLMAGLSAFGAGGGLATGNIPLAVGSVALPIAGEGARRAMLSRPVQALAAPSYSQTNAMLRMMRGGSMFTAPVAIGFGNSE